MAVQHPLPETPVLETARLVLRPIRASDAPSIQRRFSRWEVVRYLNPHTPWPYPADGAETNMAKCLGQMQRREKLLWAITLKGDDELVGRIDLWADDGVSRDQRGFWLDADLWGQGLMTEAADRVTDYAFEDLGWPHVWLSNAEANARSHRVKEKQGAQLIARTPQAYVYGDGVKVTWLLTRDAWRERRP